MEPTVLAGPVEFSPAEIAFILAVLAGIFVVVMSPGWALVAFAARRRRKAQRAGSAAGAALLGDSLGSTAMILAVLASWGSCGAVALRLSSSAEPDPRQADGPVSAPDGGWGR